MSLGRLGRTLRLDLRHHLRRPLFWIWLVVLLLLAWGMSTGTVRIQTGDTQVGGTRAWITSEFALAQILAATIFTFYVFFVAALAGTAVVQDEDEWRVGALLHATPLTPGEYVAGKALAVLATILVVLVGHLAFMAFFNHLVPSVGHADIHGPFSALNYLIPAVVFGLPSLIGVAGVSFWIGTRTRRPILVYLFPLLLVAALVFLWEWTPSWLDPRVDRLLMWLDPSGFRWLNQTWLKVDRGVEFYNTGSIVFSAGFLASRAAWAGLGVAAFWWTARGFARSLRGPDAGPAAAASAVSGEATAPPRAVGSEAGAPRPGAVGAGRTGGFRRRWAGLAALTVARAEIRELFASPALYVFSLLVLSQVLGTALVRVGPFGTRVLATPGGISVRGSDTLALLVCLLLVFYTVDVLERDRATGLLSVSRALPVGEGARVVGKALAALALPAVVLAAAVLGGVIGILVQHTVPVRLGPFAWVWGVGLMPTFLVWIAFLAAVHGLTDSRGATWAVGLGVIGLTLYRQVAGHGTWLTNWMLWDSMNWTDMGLFPLNRTPFLLNRLFYVALAVLFLALAAAWGRRREPDAVAWWRRLEPGRLALGAVRLAPLTVGPLAVGTVLWLGVQHGFQGAAARKRAADYWKKNVATYWHAATPEVAHVDLDLRLWPDRRRLRSAGTMELVNREDTTLRRVPLTGGFFWERPTWTLDGDSVQPEDRAGLYVFYPDSGLAPGDTLRIGWRYAGQYPDGWTKDGGGTGTFVLPAGVVLTSFGPMLTPIPGYQPDIGSTKERSYEARDWPDRFWEGLNPPAFGASTPFSAHIRIQGPPGFTYNSVGRLLADSVTDSLRTVVWQTDHPVRFFNVVAGRWAVRKGEGTELFYHPSHTYDLDEIASALQAARRDYSRWFAPYPWQELKLSEFPDLATYAQGFPTDITFSEGIGFLARKGDWELAPYMVTAHESAHQWWGNMVTPGEGPGGNVLSEGLAHFSTAMLLQAEKGDAIRREFMRRIESDYADSRRPDQERPLVWTDGSRSGDRAVTYDKGGWAFWMLMERMGRERMLEGLRDYVARYRDGPDYPLLADFLLVMRSHARDVDAFNAFVQRWFWEVKVPEYRLSRADARPDGHGGWTTEVVLHNDGTGDPPVELAVVAGKRDSLGVRRPDGSPGSEADSAGGDADSAVVRPIADTAAADSGGGSGTTADSDGFRVASLIVRVPAGGDTTVAVPSGFRPERAVVDPDVRLLMLGRKTAWRKVAVRPDSAG
jgi:ABC-type transport system involved in multi-copper enzyme maturation permease subunit